MSTVLCDIVTPESLLYSEEVALVAVPAAEGEIGLMNQTAPLMSTLRRGEMHVQPSEGGQPVRFALDGGYVEADGRKVVILATRAANLAEVDLEQTRANRIEAEKKLGAVGADDPHRAFLNEELAWYSLLETLLSK
ncbi:MAG: ATP synthase F1 subunit epsilon [Coriobacteriales bacterium]|jgi:F-type H+-transporting ATPase subunit epsilon|nr:ATP synthase F1 subunit epsilon [Coriobacteriales bacterium]